MITKVFTKYDKVFLCMHIPVIHPIEAFAKSDDIDLTSLEEIFDAITYGIVAVEEGLEGVRFVHYEEEK